MGIFDKLLKKNPSDQSTEKADGSHFSSVAESMAARLGYPSYVFAAGTDYDEIIRAYQESRSRGEKEGFTPVLIPADSTLDEFLGILEDEEYSLEDILKKDIDASEGKKFLEQRFQEYCGDMEEDSDMSLEDLIGAYEEEPECVDRYSSLLDYETHTTLETVLFEVPTANPWELVAYVPFGGWNECPEVEQMLAVCKYWYQKYGAVPVTISHDVLEMSVPSSVPESEALALAREHYAFTPDRVDQGTQSGTLSELAESLKVSAIWYFWWD